jgi:hypothetical protein
VRKQGPASSCLLGEWPLLHARPFVFGKGIAFTAGAASARSRLLLRAGVAIHSSPTPCSLHHRRKATLSASTFLALESLQYTRILRSCTAHHTTLLSLARAARERGQLLALRRCTLLAATTHARLMRTPFVQVHCWLLSMHARTRCQAWPCLIQASPFPHSNSSAQAPMCKPSVVYLATCMVCWGFGPTAVSPFAMRPRGKPNSYCWTCTQ